MPVARRNPWKPLALLVVTIAAVAFVLQAPSTATAASPITVAQAIGQQNGAAATVRGYVVGQPTATSTVVRSNFPGDTALALADTAAETSISRMVYVQVTAAFRAAYGLKSNPSLMGRQLDVTGPLGAYFAHAGLTSPTAFTPASGTPTSTPPPTTTTAPPTTPPTTTPPTTTPAPGDYYGPAAGKTGAALKTALHQIISTNSKITYDQVWDALKVTDQDPNNAADVLLFYTGVSQSKTSNGGGVNDWNREHVWAKSHGDFGTATGPGTDLHHLRPANVTVNGERGNKDFDNGGTAVADAPGSYTDADSWEPSNAYKGDVARMIFYMAVRYEGGDGFPDLEVDDKVNNGSAPYIGRLSVLRQWNAQDPPDAFEQHRNQVIYDVYQHNRNPFIDRPDWVNSIWN
ncbi:endonuclease [Amycolatopsis sp. H20-H5]|uniref:endonuclease n=1 Tax=Amycolatopsis sp. H20-H5 TaxID=3046309 RepID=UPI002DB6B535|nr:endonuclease [Amycolatopsis sp. H20-H5]MEC3974097.1 endonuclease [Amycolatopsis sp. H20-H5]